MSEHKISEPLGVQSHDVLEWSRSLRSRSPSPSEHRTRSRTPSPGRGSKPLSRSRTLSPGRLTKSLQNTPRKGIFAMTDVPRPSSSRTPTVSQTLGKSSQLRKSTDSTMRKSTGNMSATGKSLVRKSMGSTKEEADSIEAEYIKNLQQQIYFLELETNYLREQARKATELHPKMSAEAERMLAKLRQMQTEMDTLSVEAKRKESAVTILITDKDKLAEQLREVEEARARDKRMLMDDIIDLKKTITRLEGENSYKDSQLLDAKNELDKSATALKNAETKIITYKSQLEQRIEQHKMTQINLDEKRSELISVEAELKAMQEKYYNSTVTLQDKVTNDLREEIQTLRQKLKEAELVAEQERHLRTKMSDDGSSIVRENAVLNQRVIELTKQLEREKNLRDEMSARHTTEFSEMVQVKEKEKEMKFELNYLQERLNKEQENVKKLQEELSLKDSTTTQQELQLNTARSRVTELTGIHEMTEREANQLRKDKALLVDHVADIQKKLENKNEEVINLRSQIISLEDRCRELEQIQNLEVTSQSAKWGEFERLAESMRTLSHSMARGSGSPLGTTTLGTTLGSRSSPRPMQF